MTDYDRLILLLIGLCAALAGFLEIIGRTP